MGRPRGFEPPTSGTTNRRSNQLSYGRHTSCATSVLRGLAHLQKGAGKGSKILQRAQIRDDLASQSTAKTVAPAAESHTWWIVANIDQGLLFNHSRIDSDGLGK